MLEMILVLALSGESGKFFDRGGVDFWNSRRPATAPPAEDLWEDSPAPRPVRRLLEAPTEENARAYVEWQRRRLEGLRRAIGAVETLRNSPGGAEGEILYFSRPGCAYCVLQERELTGLPVFRVPEGSPLWREYRVTVTPTLVAGGKVFRGLTPRAALLKEPGRE